MVKRLSLAVAGILLLTLSSGMTCSEWLNLPRPGWTPTFGAYGHWGEQAAPWAVNYKGVIRYNGYWQGNFSARGELRNGDVWGLNWVQMNHFASWGQLEPLTSVGFEFIQGANLDLYRYQESTDSWVQFRDNMGANSACPAKAFAPVFEGGHTYLCGIGDINASGRRPYGVYHIFFRADPSVGSCAGGCDSYWTHKAP